jgi:hypothetical protein
MLWVPGKGRPRCQHNLGTVGAAAPGTTVTTGAASGTKGTPAPLIATTDFDAYYMRIMVEGVGANTVASDCAVDILIGAATEEILIPNLLAGQAGSLSGNGRGPKVWEFPLYIAAGQRLAAQAASLRLSFGIKVGIWLYGGDGIPTTRVGSKVTTYGMGTVPNGTPITPGATGAEGAWTQITAATSEDHFAFVPSFQVTNDTAMNARAYAVDLGLGAATEQEFGQSIWFSVEGNETMSGPIPGEPVFADIPAGTRLAMRVSSSGTNEAAYDAVIHAVS